MIIGISGKIGSGKDLAGSIIQYLIWLKDTPKDNPYTFEEYTKACTLLDNTRLISNWKIVKFADKLKDIVCILLGCTREQLEDRVFKETLLGEEWTCYGYANGFWSHSDNNPSHKMMDNVSCDKETYEAEKRTNWQTSYKRELTPRLLLQLMGTECGRQIIHPNIWVNATMIDYRPYGYEKGSNKNVADVLEDIHFNTLNYPNWIITDVRFPNEAKAITDRGGINIRLQRNENKQVLTSTDIHPSETALDLYKFDYVIDNNSTIEELIEKLKEILLIEKII